MNKSLRIFSILQVIALLAVVALAGCSSDNDSGQAQPSATPRATAGQTPAVVEPDSDGKYDPPLTISYLKVWNTDVTFKNGENENDNVHTRWALDTLGIKLDSLWASSNVNDAFDTKLRLMLSANQELPDLLLLRSDFNLVRELIDSGKFADGGELFDQYASQSWKDAVAESPTAWYPWMKDGQRIGIPIMDYAYANDPVIWIREDWRQKLNLPEPETIEDFELLLEAFTNGDPDDNGIADTYGLTIGIKNELNTWMSDAGWIFGAYGALPNQWNEDGNGLLEYGSINPGMKQGLAKLNEWMSKGYVPTEAGLFDEVKASELFTAGRAGMVAGPNWMPSWPLEDVKANVPGAEYKAYPVPLGSDGQGAKHGTTSYSGVILVNKDFEHPEAFFTYQNYLFDHYANPQTGSEFEFGLAEDYDWTMIDGKPSVDPATIPGEYVPVFKYTLAYEGARIPSLQMATMAKLNTGTAPSTPYELTILNSTNPAQLHAAQIVLDQQPITFLNLFTGAPTDTMKEKLDILRTLEQDTFNQIIYGNQPVDSFDDFVAKWNSSGGEQITKEVNEWYQSVKGN